MKTEMDMALMLLVLSQLLVETTKELSESTAVVNLDCTLTVFLEMMDTGFLAVI